LTVEGIEVVADDDHVSGFALQGDHVAFADPVAGYGDALSVDEDVAVAHQLAGLSPAGTPTGPEHHVVDSQLEHAQQVLTRDSLLPVGFLVEVVELLLEYTVDPAGLLLLAQLGQILRTLAHPVPAVFTRRIRAPLDGALHRVALRTLEEELHLFPATESAHRTCISSHDCVYSRCA
jgi:hypothetical protein